LDFVAIAEPQSHPGNPSVSFSIASFIPTKNIPGYYDEEEKAFLSLTRERYFPHVLDKRARIGKSLDEFVKARLTRLLKDLGNEEFLGLFGPLEDQVDFQDHSNGAMKTLLGPIPGFPNSVRRYI
jgi:hypothetical protein